MEHDLKRLLAYHSIENIGIILMGLGAALIFRVAGHPMLAAVALVAVMFHTLNHAIFKSLLFLGAGSVLHSTGTRNMEEMGGLIRPMPVTAFCFLIGAIAISGLPPLNGFASEWLTYQTLLAGFGAISGLRRILFPLAGSMLALTGALAAACFVTELDDIVALLNRNPAHAQGAELVRRFVEQVYIPQKYENGDWRRATGQEAEYLFRRSILSEIGELRCRDLKAAHLRAVLRKLAGTGLSYESVSKVKCA